jgi:hypothetical protein
LEKSPPRPRRAVKRVPLEMSAAEHAHLRAWAAANGFTELAPAIRWGLRQLGGLPPVPAPQARQAAPEGAE